MRNLVRRRLKENEILRLVRFEMQIIGIINQGSWRNNAVHPPSHRGKGICVNCTNGQDNTRFTGGRLMSMRVAVDHPRDGERVVCNE